MFTICPNCDTVFELELADVNRARGQVRCGECETVFDATGALSHTADFSDPITADSVLHDEEDPSFAETGIGWVVLPAEDEDAIADDEDAQYVAADEQEAWDSVGTPPTLHASNLDTADDSTSDEVADEQQQSNNDFTETAVHIPVPVSLAVVREPTLTNPQPDAESGVVDDDTDYEDYEEYEGYEEVSDLAADDGDETANGGDKTADGAENSCQDVDDADAQDWAALLSEIESLDEANDSTHGDWGTSNDALDALDPVADGEADFDDPDGDAAPDAFIENVDDDFLGDVVSEFEATSATDSGEELDSSGIFVAEVELPSREVSPETLEGTLIPASTDEPAPQPASAGDGPDPFVAEATRADLDDPFATGIGSDDDIRLPRRPYERMWSLLAIAALVLGGAQYLHHNRSTLATNATLSGLFETAYGDSLDPHWDIRNVCYERRASYAADDIMVIYARLANRSPAPVPYPLFHVTLSGRYDNGAGNQAVSHRILEPEEYLDRDDIPARVGSGVTFEAFARLVDPGPEVTGYDVEVCYRRADGYLYCNGGCPQT